MAVSMKLETVTPAIAEEWLGKNRRNRNLNQRNIRRWAGAMERGEWKVNGDPIRFNTAGDLIDGQHRLMAVLESDASIETFVVRGLEDQAQETIDVGASRSFAHVLRIRGYTSATQVASSVRSLYAYKAEGRFDTGQLKTTPTNQELLKVLAENKGILESLSVVESHRKASPIKFSAGFVALHYVISSRFDEETANGFFNNLVDFSYGDSQSDPIVQLRKRLLADDTKGGAKGGYGIRFKMALTVKAFNAWMKGEDVKLLAWRPGGPAPEPFPSIVSEDQLG